MEDFMRNNLEKSRFELESDGLITFADYKLQDNVITISHVEAPVEQRGSGTAGNLMEEIAKKATAENLKIIPVCGYASVWLRRHKEYRNLII
jgi:predicted GNAT family acetyltransferase